MFVVTSACCPHDSSNHSACHDLHPESDHFNGPFWVESLHSRYESVQFDHSWSHRLFFHDHSDRCLFSETLMMSDLVGEKVPFDLWTHLSGRVGEADNPGPLRVGTFNPHQIFNKEDVICEWGHGIWAGSETSHTVDAMNVSRSRFRKAGFFTAWSSPVAKHTRDAGLFRGRASGTCLVSHLRLKPYPAAISGVAEQSSRVVESLVNVGNGTNMFVACLYGPTHNTTFFDPWALLSAACKETFDHALHFLILGPCCLQLAKRLSIMLWLSRVLQSSWVILTWSCVRFQDGMPYKEQAGLMLHCLMLIAGAPPRAIPVKTKPESHSYLSMPSLCKL